MLTELFASQKKLRNKIEQLLREISQLKEEKKNLEVLLQTDIGHLSASVSNTQSLLQEQGEQEEDKPSKEVLLETVIEQVDSIESLLHNKTQAALPEELQLESLLEETLEKIEEISIYPTHCYQGFKVRLGQLSGHSFPFGATVVPWGLNFSIFSQHATSCVLVLFEKGKIEPMVEIPFRGIFEQLDTQEP
ncbi:MAG: hypothetical protein DRR19_26565, partial [Candidatus Parabeggiatoa sp. nov. 1]